MMTRTTAALVLLAFTFTASPGAGAQKPTADEKELASYTLTLPTVRKAAAVAKRFNEIAAANPKVKEAAKVRAEIAELEKKDELTGAEQTRLETLTARAETLEEEIDREVGMGGAADSSIDEIVARIEREPQAKAALAREGLTAREFAKTFLALFQAAMIKAFSQGKVDMTRLPPGVNPANVKFVEEHEAELKKLQAALTGGARN